MFRGIGMFSERCFRWSHCCRPAGLMPTIADIYPGADWAERETRDYFAVEFEGRDSTPPLMLRDTDRPGILLETNGAVR